YKDSASSSLGPGTAPAAPHSMPDDLRSRSATNSSFPLAAAVVLFGTIALSLHVDAILREPERASALIGAGLWRNVVGIMGGRIGLHGNGLVAEIPFATVFLGMSAASGLAWLAGAAVIARRRAVGYRHALGLWGRWGWLWWLLPFL